MAIHDRIEIVRDTYRAYEHGDRQLVEKHLSGDYIFFSPYDVGIDRARYFERCWPDSDQIEEFQFRRLIEVGDEVIVTYESKRRDGDRFCNTEIFTFAGDQICRTEVYFGWDLK